jgi:hypothetical protein
MAKLVSAKITGDKELNKLIKSMPDIVERELKREIKRSAEAIKNEYRRNLKDHVETGDLRDSISVGIVGGGFGAEVGSDKKHAIFIEYGTQAHEIKPKHAQFLSFYWPKLARRMFLKKVEHPGTKPYLSLTKAYASVMLPISKFIARLKDRLRNIR